MMMLLFSSNPKNRRDLNLLKLEKISFLLNLFNIIKMTRFDQKSLMILKNKINPIKPLCSKMKGKMNQARG